MYKAPVNRITNLFLALLLTVTLLTAATAAERDNVNNAISCTVILASGLSLS
jgi:hypothetical protein